MSAPRAARLLSAVGASPAFVEDVLGDLEELRTQREAAGRAAGRAWYATEVLRALPYALREGTRGTGLAHLGDWTQKAMAAWLLLGTVALIGGALSYGVWVTFNPPEARPIVWFPSDTVLVAMLAAATVRCLLLGYAAASMERERPLLVTVLAAMLDASVHLLLMQRTAGEFGAGVFLVSVLSSVLITAGGVWRVMRAPHERCSGGPETPRYA